MQMKNYFNSLLVATVLLCCPMLHAQTWDLAADLAESFGSHSNPNGQWSYGYSGDANEFHLCTYAGPNLWSLPGQLLSWHPSQSEPKFALFYNSDPTQWIQNFGPGEAGIHPASDDTPGVFRWTAPSAGLATIEGSFGGQRGTETSYFVLHNNAKVYLKDMYTPEAHDFVLKLVVEANDTVDFAVHKGSTYSSDYTSVAASITLEDLPASTQVWNFYDEFSLVNNPNGQWSYGYTTAATLGGGSHPTDSFTLYGYSQAGGTSEPASWQPDATNDLPGLRKNTSVDTVIWEILPLDVALHPSNKGTSSVVRWTAPQRGIATFLCDFGKSSAGSIDCFINQNGTNVLFESFNSNDDNYVAVETGVEANDTIDFGVHMGIDSYNGDFTQFDVTVLLRDVETCEDAAIFGYTLVGNISGDCYVNMADFVIMAANWLDCIDPTDETCNP